MRGGSWLLVVSALGCDRVLAIEDLPRAEPDAGVTPDAGPMNVECVSCAAAQCARERQACDGDARCASLARCLDRCPTNDVLCRAACERNSSGASGLTPFLTLDACRRTNCIDACYGAKGLLASIDPACACADDLCADQATACVRSGLERGGPSIGSCERRVACMAGRANPDSFVACDPLDGKQEEWNRLKDCARKAPCSTNGKACSMATGNLSCVDNFRYGSTRENVIQVSLAVGRMTLDSLSSFPRMVGATIKACPAGNCATCASPAATGETGESGMAVLPVPTAFGVFTGCFRVTPPAPAPGDTGNLPELMVYSGRKLHLDEDVIWTLDIARDVVDYFSSVEGPGGADWVGHGQVIGTLHDCVWLRAVDARIELSPPGDEKTRVVYLNESGVAFGAKATTVTGGFGIIDVPPGKRTIIARKGDAVIATLDIDVAPGVLVDANVFPRELP